MVDTRNIWMNSARKEIADVLQQVMDEHRAEAQAETEDMAEYNAGYGSAILDIARKFKFGFYGQPDGTAKIQDLLKNET